MVPEGPLYEKGAGWLGWDAVAGRETPPQEPGGLPMAPGDLTATPARYGFHGTIKPPFRLAGGRDADSLREALRAFCAARAPIQCPPLEVRILGRFVALVPSAPAPGLRDLANSAVEAFDPWRTPASEAELARRRKAGLSDRQEALLQKWGYPYVMDEFRFHITLTGRVAADLAPQVAARLSDHFADCLGPVFRVGSLCLVGEGADGRFHVIDRVALGA